jgi:hypothetical protein
VVLLVLLGLLYLVLEPLLPVLQSLVLLLFWEQQLAFCQIVILILLTKILW